MKKRAQGAAPDHQPFAFHSEQIEAAFYRALGRYRLPKLPIRVLLFRPKFEAAYDLGEGRSINAERVFIYRDNGWTPYVDAVDIRHVPGDHDSMVLEPNVRVLAAKMRQAIEAAELAQGSSVFAPGRSAAPRAEGARAG
jgi:thioesterase domain-containing protein